MEDVIERDANGAPVVPAGQGGDKGKGGDETVTLSKAEVESLRRELGEARESERYWAGVARNGGGQHAEPAEEPAEELDPSQFVDDKALDGLEGDTPAKLVDDLAAQGVAGLKARGFITAADAHKLAVEVAAKVSRELIGRERQKITTDTQLMTEFPELKDPQSELFKETARRYQKAVAMDPTAKKTPAALYLAAEAAREVLKARQPARRDNDRFDREDEEDRRRRADSQDGRPRGGRGDVEDHDDMLGDEARQVIKAMGITEAEFQESRKTTASKGRQR